MTETVLFKMALAAYLASAVVYGGSLLERRVLTARFGAGLMLVALGIHTFYYLFRWVADVDIPSVDVYDTISFFAWAMAASYLAMQLRTKTRVLGAFVAPVISVLMVIASIDHHEHRDKRRDKSPQYAGFVAPVISVLMVIASIDLGGSVAGSIEAITM